MQNENLIYVFAAQFGGPYVVTDQWGNLIGEYPDRTYTHLRKDLDRDAQPNLFNFLIQRRCRELFLDEYSVKFLGYRDPKADALIERLTNNGYDASDR